MKKIVSVLLFLIMLFSVFIPFVHADDDLTLVIDGKKISTDVNPMIIESRTMVPIRVLFDSFGADVLWNEALRQAIISTKTTVIVFTIDSKTAYVDGVGKSMDVAPTIVNGRTLVPIRFISGVLGYDVEWNGSTRTVYVKSKAPIPDTDEKDEEENMLPKLSEINVTEKSSSVEITVSLSERVKPKTLELSSPDRLVFDFYGVNGLCEKSNITFENSTIKEIRWAHHTEYTRVVVETFKKSQYSIRYTTKACIITVEKSRYTQPDDEKEDEENNTLPESDGKYETPVITGKTPVIAIDAGHGGYDSGALGYNEDGEVVLKEKEVNLTISKYLEKRLKDAGIKVIMTRSGDVALGDTVMADLVARSEIANKSMADLFISVHNNAFTDPESTGTSVLYPGLSNAGEYGITSEELAKNIQKPLVKATGLKDRGIVESPEMVVLKKTNMPAVLLECAFVTSYNDQKVLSDDRKLSQIADAIYEGLIISLRQMGKIE